MPTDQYQTKRKTTEIAIDPEDWQNLIQWLKTCRRLRPKPNIYIEENAQQPLRAIQTKANSLNPNQTMKLRLPHQQVQALADQARLWEACMDELPQAAQRYAPAPGYFQSIALGTEAALTETHTPPTNPRKLNCRYCLKPIQDNQPATATVDLNDNSKTNVQAAHSGCKPAGQNSNVTNLTRHNSNGN